MLYTIEDKTLIAMGDAVRSYDKVGEWRETDVKQEPDLVLEFEWDYDYVVNNFVDSGTTNGYYYYTMPREAFENLFGKKIDLIKNYRHKVSYEYEKTNDNINRVGLTMNRWTDIDANTADKKMDVTFMTTNQLYSSPTTLDYIDSINCATYPYYEFRFTIGKSNYNINTIHKFKIEIWGLNENQKYIIKNTLTPLEMVDEVYGIIDDFANAPTIPEEALTITGNCDNRFLSGGWDWFIEQYGDKITTNNIYSAEAMFQYSSVSSIPFSLNFYTHSTAKENVMGSMFYSCDFKNVPIVNYARPSDLSSLFGSCYYLREIPEDWCDNWDWSYMDNLTSSSGGSMGRIFTSCASLRKYPNSILSHGNPSKSTTSNVYYYIFNSCYVLDEIIDLPFPHYKSSWTSNAFNSSFVGCYRLKNMTFATQEDGTPYVMKWKNQTIDLTSYVGYIGASTNITAYSETSGITLDKQVYNDATYQALKDDVDWIAADIEYSRYNHTSAVATINSLPDCSATGTNTIKFKGASGALTDGGAINTLTEEEIAVAAAKGWTVSLV